MSEPDVTPESHPDHHTVGQYFQGYNIPAMWPCIFYCESHDREGYWMAAQDGTGHRTNVSERAIGRTFHLKEKERIPELIQMLAKPKVIEE